MPQPLHIQNAYIYNGKAENSYDQRDLYTTDVVVAERPKNALAVDLSGYTIFPGLINAHDHLELNHYPRTKFRERYDNASQWSQDVNAHLNDSPYKELRSYPLEDRCFIGGLKNLLCGVTTVIHHNPPHKPLFRKDFPVRVLKKYGWAHSLYLSTDAEIVASYKRTPPDVPWFIHLAEGTDEAAAGEYQRLKALGCVGKNTVIIHGVGLTDEDIADAAPRVRGLVWCPTTNLYLLGKQPYHNPPGNPLWLRWMKAGGKLAIGSDSRLTAEGDLLNEIKKSNHLAYVTSIPAKMLGKEECGNLDPKAVADWIALRWSPQPDSNYPEGYNPELAHFKVMDALRQDSLRANLALVVRGGVPQLGSPDLMAKFPYVETVAARLDDTDKSINVTLARQIARCSLKEPGLKLLEVPGETSVRRLWNGVIKR